MDEQERQERVDTAIAFALQVLGGELVEGEPARGSALWHLERLGALVSSGEMTEEELQAELVRLEATHTAAAEGEERG